MNLSVNITLLSVTYPLKRGVQRLLKAYLWSTNDGNATWTVNGVKDPGKVRNRRVAKSRTVLITGILILLK